MPRDHRPLEIIQDAVIGKKKLDVDRWNDGQNGTICCKCTVVIGTLTTENLERTNSSTIARLFNDSIKLLGETFNSDDILLFLTDAVPYTIKAGSTLKVLYPKMIHITCLAHALNRGAEKYFLYKVQLELSNFVLSLVICLCHPDLP